VRARVAGRVTAEQERVALRVLDTLKSHCDIVELGDVVLMRAGLPFPVEPIRTLDALHIATAELLDERPQLVTIVTRDERVRNNARSLGFAVL
jgi:predicted nucleic acid-binding protein